jgi:DNA modification methylase
MKFNCAHTEIVELHKLQPNPKNPNAHPEKQIAMLAKIIDYQGQRSPIVVSNRSGFITKGHGRLEALQRLKWDEAAVDYQDYDSEAQEYADMIADNKIAELANHDDNMMINDLKDIDLPDYDLLGIPDFEMPKEIEPQCDEDEVPSEADTRCKLGDVWTLGDHRLLCGDATDVLCVEKLMDGAKADMVFTDPPYGYSYESNYQDKHKMLKNDDKILDFMPVMLTAMDENSTAYVCGSHQTIEKWKPLFCDNLSYKNLIVWKKNHWSMGDLKGSYAGQHELILFGSRGKQDMLGKRETDVWSFDRTPPDNHPTQKPIDLIEYALSKFKSGKVLDLFGGSGSTLIACEKTNRKCYMMELDPHYCDVILSRWEKYTGKEAKLL